MYMLAYTLRLCPMNYSEFQNLSWKISKNATGYEFTYKKTLATYFILK